MSRRGKRHGQRLADMTIQPAAREWEDPDPDECEEEEFWVDLDEERVHQRLRSWRGQLVEFSVVLQTWDASERQWLTVARADTCHREVHIHRYEPTGKERARRPIRSIDKFEDISTGYEQICDTLIEGKDEAVRRWRRGR